MTVILYRVKDKEIAQVHDTKLDPTGTYIIVDKHTMKPKIWVWTGPECNAKDRYYAGVVATSIKAQERLYGSPIEIVRGGSEPDQFPQLSTSVLEPVNEGEKKIILEQQEIPKIIETQKPVIETQKPVVEIDTKIENEAVKEITQADIDKDAKKIGEEITTSTEVEPIPKVEEETEKPSEVVQSKRTRRETKAMAHTLLKPAASNNLLVEKMKGLLKDLAQDMQNMQNKINNFLSDL